ncbi:hypothetical protein A6A04_09070 [Paramagnetospirillum marisnigri]|uniref:Uncharacterized protein n=1 Tax=Paramagnetospirillum marisnigri TaxID=1285242 RepID=A0A178M5K0_9PROT|nr:tetratricopeptide repeat protein [Paramagnetospirillum marisnigri]OAN44022.1 hypothetical protein A6A04_09070 [Paramagnetospirillum marisnigri]
MDASRESRLATAIERHKRGLLTEAEAEYRRLLDQFPDFAEAHNALGIALQQQEQVEAAADCFRVAARLKPDYVSARANLGAALLGLGRADEAVEALNAALDLDPANAEIHYNLAWAAQQHGDTESALAGYGRALALNPGHAAACNNTGLILRAQGRLAEAVAAYDLAVELAPANAVIRYGRAQARLESGDFAGGWRDHEARFVGGIALARHESRPRWDGEDIQGKPILVWAEQGLGDSMQFCRYLPILAQRGAQVVFEVQPPLERLCRQSLPGMTIVARGQPLPPCQVQVPLMSLPRLLGEMPFWPGAYLRPDPAEAAAWKPRLGPRLRPRVALVWAGSPTHKDDRNRSLPLAVLAPLLALDGVDWLSFQVGEAAAQAEDAPALRRLPHGLGDFADTAAALVHMDLVVAVDTAVLHLAGSLGLPAWGMLPFAPDWRWLQGRDDSPWYPSMRLFRQGPSRDWKEVVARLAETLPGAFQELGQGAQGA